MSYVHINTMEDGVVCTETYGSSSLKREYSASPSSGNIVVVNRSQNFTSVSQFFSDVFLPQGYPASVSSDYLSYQIWDTVQAFASSISGTLAAQAVLKGVGVGDENATVLAATMTWILKDGTGMLGKIIFAWLKGSTFDADAKRWRFFADVLNDFTMFLEILAPTFQEYFLFIVCTSGLCKSIVGVTGGATRAALTQHQARRNNMADVSAKDGSQETMVNLAGLVASIFLVPIVTEKPFIIWTLFVLATVLHLFANYRAVTSVVIEILNQTRLRIILKTFLKNGAVPPLSYVNYREPVLWPIGGKYTVKLGSTFKNVCSNENDLLCLEKVYSSTSSNYLLNIKDDVIHIALYDKATSLNQLEGCFQAEVINYVAENISEIDSMTPELKEIAIGISEGNRERMLKSAHHYTTTVFQQFLVKLQQTGWQTSRVLLCSEEWRSKWSFHNENNKNL